MNKGLSKQAKVLSDKQIKFLLAVVDEGRNPIRNRTLILLSFKAGLRAKEIASLKWSMVLNSEGQLAGEMHLPNSASKGKRSGRVIPIHPELKKALEALYDAQKPSDFVIQTERADRTTPQVIVNFFQSLYKKCGIDGASSHSGRRTFITTTARKISTVGGSLNDVRSLAGHSSLQTTMHYIDENKAAKAAVINLL